MLCFDVKGDERPRFVLPLDDAVRISKVHHERYLAGFMRTLQITNLNYTKRNSRGSMDPQKYKEFVIRAADQDEATQWLQALTEHR